MLANHLIGNHYMNRIEQFWDKFAIKYDKEAKKDERIYAKIIGNAKKYLRIDHTVLDCGCATGIVAFEIADKVKQVIGIDISTRMIDAANSKITDTKVRNVTFAQQSIFHETLRRESFDAILILNILHFFADTQKAMIRLNDLLKPGGFVISATACMGEKKSIVNMTVSLMVRLGMFPPFKFFSISEVEGCMTKSGLKTIESEILTRKPTIEYFIVAQKEK
jgi:ubiquinone/menaquinone biosynthesis C-methylase UbiE